MANLNNQMSQVLMATTGAHIVATPRLSIKLSATENVTFAGRNSENAYTVMYRQSLKHFFYLFFTIGGQIYCMYMLKEYRLR